MVGNNPLPVQHKDAMTQLVEERERLQGLLKSISIVVQLSRQKSKLFIMN